MDYESLGRWLVVGGLGLLLIGGLVLLLARLGVGRLPGDVVYEGRNLTVFIPIGLSILVSIILTVILNIWLRR